MAYASSLADAIAEPFRKNEMMPVARAEVRAGLGNTDDRAATAQLLQAQPEVQVPLEI